MNEQDNRISDGNFVSGQREEAFIALLTANHKRIYGFIRAVVPHWSDADDIMQETVMAMWRKFQDFERGTDFAAWGIAVARYRIQKFRSKYTARMAFGDEALQQITARYMATLESMDERMDALEHCVARLRDRDRQLIRMRYEHGLRAAAMADHAGLSVHGIYKTMARIHNMLLRCVRRRLADWGVA